MARNTSLRSSGGSGSKSELSVPFFHAPAPALPFPFNSSDEEEEEGVDGGGEEEERAAAAWAARFCESEAPNAVDAEAEAEWLARTATATAATAAPAGAGGARAAAAAEGGRKRRRLAKKRRLGETQAGEGEGRGTAAETANGEDDEADGEEEEEGDEDDNAEGMLYIHNVMAYAQLNCPVNLDAACQTFGNAVYMPGIFESVRVDLRCRTHCIASINIFSNGKLTGTGANSVEELRHAMKKVGRRLQLHPLTRCSVVFSHFRVKNILGSFSFSSLLSLHALAAERGLAADYEPERFPAVKVRVPVPAGGVHKQQQAVGQEQIRGKTGEGDEKTGKGGGGGGTGGQKTGGGVWSLQKQQQQDEKKEQQQVLHAAWNNSGNNSSVSASPSSKDEVVTLHLFSTGNVTLFGGRSVESLQYALQCVLPFLYKCRARTD